MEAACPSRRSAEKDAMYRYVGAALPADWRAKGPSAAWHVGFCQHSKYRADRMINQGGVVKSCALRRMNDELLT